VPCNGVHPFERGSTRQRAADGAGLGALSGRAGPKPRSRRKTPATTRRWANPTGRSTATAGPTQGRRHEGISRLPHRGAAELRPTLTKRPPRLAAIGGPFNASRSRTFAPPLRSSSRFPCRPRTAFGTPAACRNAPAPASRLPVLGPMLCSETSRRTARRAPRRGQFRTANGPSRPPTNGGAAQILYSKTGHREIQKAGPKWRCLRARRNHSWQANVALGVRLDSDLAALRSDFGRNVTLNRFQTRGCCAKRACCITLQHHDQPESW
jgi:hypothetical protein